MSMHRAGRDRTIMRDGPDPIDIHVGQRLRLARRMAGITQTKLANVLGISFQAVQKYEQGENRISASRLYATARAVNRPVSYFFDDVDDSPEVKASFGFSNDEIALVRSYRRLPDDALRRHLVEMTKRIGGNGAGVTSPNAEGSSRKR